MRPSGRSVSALPSSRRLSRVDLPTVRPRARARHARVPLPHVAHRARVSQASGLRAAEAGASYERPAATLPDAVSEATGEAEIGPLAPSGAAPSDAATTAEAALAHDVHRSLGVAAKLGSAQLITWIIGVGVRIYLPRHLGPDAFGGYQFADAFTTTVFLLASLGVDTYILKEVATRREHASDFFGGILLLRFALNVCILVGSLVALRAGGKGDEVLVLVVVLGLAQMLTYLSATYSTMLQAVSEVNGLAAWNMIGKLAWGVGIMTVILLGGHLYAVALAVLASEIIRGVAIAGLARRHLALRYRIDVAATRRVLRVSLPFFTGIVAQTVYSRIDVSIMAFMASPREVGWYGAASNLAGLSLLLAPIVGWVLMPLSSRAAARSREELMLVNRRAMEMILSAAVPVSLFLFLGARDLIPIVFGDAYAPAALSLRLLAFTFVLTYAAIVSSTILVRLERSWAVTGVAISAMFLTPALNLWLVPHFARTLGAGGAGVGAGTALVVTELYTALVLAWLIGRDGVDARLVGSLAKTVGVCIVVVAAHHWLLAPLGVWRLGADMALYAAGVFGTGAVRHAEIVGMVRGILDRRRASALPA